ncbi:MobF family relaxase [Caballeronia sp. GAFFF2]|uniref:MobF family relaxase n=1 Tax=Caballeronia sp. GAFFF2 TaxID=2921741 RepID=UPI0020284F6C
MLSITKINSAKSQAKSRAGAAGYLFYLGAPSTRQRGDFDDYARGKSAEMGPAPFWVGRGATFLGVGGEAEPEHVDRLSRGFHPITGNALVKGAGDSHVMGLDLTFSAPKDFSAVFAAADSQTRDALLQCLHGATRAALEYAEKVSVTRHGKGGRDKQLADAAVGVCYTHFSSRSGDPQLHCHAFVFNAGKRAGSNEWSALEQSPQFERKMATGALFRVELACRLAALGFAVEPDGPYFKLRGVSDAQRAALSTRSREINEHVSRAGGAGSVSAARDVAALNTRAAKREPPLPELLEKFSRMTAALGLTPSRVDAMRMAVADYERNQSFADGAGAELGLDEPAAAPFSIDHQELLASLTLSQSCATPQEALAAICERAMGRWSATECLSELNRFLASEHVVPLGRTELLTPVFTSRATIQLEGNITARVREGRADLRHRIDASLVSDQFNALETDLARTLGVPVALDEQRAAALHIATQTGDHAFVEGWAGAGKTTLLRALSAAYATAGFSVLGCCQSAAAAQNLARECGIDSRTIASLLLSLRNNPGMLSAKSILVLDEAGMVGSREFGLLQDAALAAGAKLVAVGDPKQLQPIEAGGIFRALVREHGAADLSEIRRQRTDFAPMLDWLHAQLGRKNAVIRNQLSALRSLPDEAKMQAIAHFCERDAKLRQGFSAWRARFDHEWLRSAVELFARGQALPALRMLDAHGRLLLSDGLESAMSSVVERWATDKTELRAKTMIAATRANVAELNRRARAALVSKGVVRDAAGLDIAITRRDGCMETKRFAPGDRIVFTQNDRELGVANGATATICRIHSAISGSVLIAELDDANPRGEKTIAVPASFGRFDLAFCLTNNKAQGRTFDSVVALAEPSADREWTYVAASRSRFATTFIVDQSAIAPVDPEAHQSEALAAPTREQLIEALARRMSRSRSKGSTLDYLLSPDASPFRATETDRRLAANDPAPSRAVGKAAKRDPCSQLSRDSLAPSARSRGALRRIFQSRARRLEGDMEAQQRR